MKAHGMFTWEARCSIQARDLYRCVGCGAAGPLNLQHRIGRGMGGTRQKVVRTPANGIVLCGSGTTGCHGWATDHPVDAALLGWRIHREGADPHDVPYWSHTFGWRRVDREWLAVFVDVPELDEPAARAGAVERFVAWRDERAAS